MSFSKELPTLDATRSLAAKLAELVRPPLTIGLVGTLGAGKTQLVRFLAAQWGVGLESVTSPTYILLRNYVGRYPINHFDWYRLESAAEVWDLGIDELFEQNCIVLIEWADKFPQCLPDDCLTISLTQTSDEARIVEIRGSGPRSLEVVQTLRAI